jgi:glycosyltransferase involved in cell wall biosynthesis
MTKNLRIAIVCPYYPWPPSVGGVETVVREVSIELARRRNEVHVVTTPFNALTLKQVADYGTEEKDGVIIHKLRSYRLKIGYTRLFKGLKNMIQEIRPDIIHSHNLHPHLFQLARWKREIGYKLITELHYPVVNIESFLAKAALPFALKYLANIASAIDLFIAHTEIERKWLIQNNIATNKICKIMFPGIPHSLLITQPTSTLIEVADLIFVGRVIWMKGLDILVRSLRYVNDTINKKVKLTVVGPHDEGYIKHLKNLVDELKLGECISFRGVVSEEEKRRLIMTHKVLVLPSRGDYTPSVILEAYALGTPVIATRVGALPEMVVNQKTGLLVKPGDVAELAEAIKNLLLNDDLRRSMAIKAKEFSRNFLLEPAVEKLNSLYFELANSSI